MFQAEAEGQQRRLEQERRRKQKERMMEMKEINRFPTGLVLFTLIVVVDV